MFHTLGKQSDKWCRLCERLEVKASSANDSHDKLGRLKENKSVSLTTQVALVWSVATHGCKSWTLKKQDETHRKQTFENNCTRKLLRIRWTNLMCTEQVYKMAGRRNRFAEPHQVNVTMNMWEDSQKITVKEESDVRSRGRKQPVGVGLTTFCSGLLYRPSASRCEREKVSDDIDSSVQPAVKMTWHDITWRDRKWLSRMTHNGSTL